MSSSHFSVSHIIMDYLVSALLRQCQNSILWLEPPLKNNLSVKQTKSEWDCPECTKRSTALLAKPRVSLTRIMCLMFILVVLETPSLITNNSASKAVVLLAGVFKDDAQWPGFQKCAAEITCIFLGDIALGSVTIIRVEEKEKASRQKLL